MPLPTVEKIWHSVLHYLSNPWAALILLYLLHRLLRWAWPLLASPLVGRWEGWKARREEAEEATLHRKDPEARQARMEALGAARLALQARYDQLAEEERVRREEKRRRKTEKPHKRNITRILIIPDENKTN